MFVFVHSGCAKGVFKGVFEKKVFERSSDIKELKKVFERSSKIKEFLKHRTLFVSSFEEKFFLKHEVFVSEGRSF